MPDATIIFCAIDTPDVEEACELSKEISPVTGGIKLGLEFFNYNGPAGIEKILKAAPDTQLFIDLKFHDIPNTVAGAVRSICSHFQPEYLNVHASGGLNMMQAAQKACETTSKGATKLLAVTILTSLDQTALDQIGYQKDSVAERVSNLVQLTKDAGLSGVVCSSHEISTIREHHGKEFALMVPGIRPEGSAPSDQSRIMTPSEALEKGASHLVIGRPITGAENPAQAAQDILDSL